MSFARDGQIERLECVGMPLGILGSDLYCAPSFAEFKPQPGDSLVLATDGFFDQRGDDGSRFAKKIVDILARRASLATGIKSLWDAFRAHTANVEIEDDVTVALLSFVNDASSRLAA
ncbi:MAG: SpoIIE family protein phosphatase [Planctomycetes bacterium]|nr:SpoIIE family protein phosphatase [Planctomycetota bacterium]